MGLIASHGHERANARGSEKQGIQEAWPSRGGNAGGDREEANVGTILTVTLDAFGESVESLPGVAQPALGPVQVVVEFFEEALWTSSVSAKRSCIWL